MAHHVYQSLAFILGGTDIGDANRYVDLFTRELGLIRGVARSVRVERSKLRYSLQPYTFGNVSLVRGHAVWRITGAMEEYNAYYRFKEEKEKLVLLYNITTLLKRLLQGEEQNEYLFDIVHYFITYLDETKLKGKELTAVEYITVLRILYSLGYVKKRGKMFDANGYEHEYLKTILKEEKDIRKEINSALNESHL